MARIELSGKFADVPVPNMSFQGRHQLIDTNLLKKE